MNTWRISILVLVVFLVLGPIIAVVFILENNKTVVKDDSLTSPADSSLVQPISAEEIYPFFKCPCCGQSIAKECCGMSKERRAFVDGLTAAGNLSEDEVILIYVKKYGLDSFTEEGESKQVEVRGVLITQAPADRPMISLGPEVYDFGDVSQKEGKVYTYFDLKNEGKNDLVIERLETSCGCTFAAVVFQDKESPYFTMPGHGDQPDWEGMVIPPGETAQLKVMYDPNVHKDFRGAATREIHVFSNDPVDFEKKVRVELNQVD